MLGFSLVPFLYFIFMFKMGDKLTGRNFYPTSRRKVLETRLIFTLRMAYLLLAVTFRIAAESFNNKLSQAQRSELIGVSQFAVFFS